MTTDDWPYFYQHEPGVPAIVIAISIVLLLLCVWALPETGISVRSIQWHFFFLGAGFLLMEVQIISKMGTTWVVNSIVISGLLLLIVASNLTAKLFPQIQVKWPYLVLMISMSVSYLAPVEALFLKSAWVRDIKVTVRYGVPPSSPRISR